MLLTTHRITVIRTAPTFKKLGFIKLHNLFDYHSLLFVHDYLFNTLPGSFNGCFSTNSGEMSNSKATRQSKLFYVPNYPLKLGQRQPIDFLPIVWNKLISENASRSHTKRIIKSILLRDYTDVRCENMRCSEYHFNFN